MAPRQGLLLSADVACRPDSGLPAARAALRPPGLAAPLRPPGSWASEATRRRLQRRRRRAARPAAAHTSGGFRPESGQRDSAQWPAAAHAFGGFQPESGQCEPAQWPASGAVLSDLHLDTAPVMRTDDRFLEDGLVGEVFLQDIQMVSSEVRNVEGNSATGQRDYAQCAAEPDRLYVLQPEPGQCDNAQCAAEPHDLFVFQPESAQPDIAQCVAEPDRLDILQPEPGQCDNAQCVVEPHDLDVFQPESGQPDIAQCVAEPRLLDTFQPESGQRVFLHAIGSLHAFGFLHRGDGGNPGLISEPVVTRQPATAGDTVTMHSKDTSSNPGFISEPVVTCSLHALGSLHRGDGGNPGSISEPVVTDDGLEEDLYLGDRIALQGLVSKPELNGARGFIEEFIPRTERFAVTLDSGKSMSVSLANIKLL